MVIVFFGTPQFAVPTLEALIASRHQVALVVTQPDKRRDRGQKISDAPVKAAARAHNVPVLQPERLRDPAVAETLRQHGPDLGVVAAYGKLIPADLLLLPRLGMVNVHASLLPKYRGAAPIHRSIINGDAETGVTIMQMVEALDAGDMLAKAVRPIGPDETSVNVERGLAQEGARLLLDVIERLEAGTIRPEPQDDSASTHAPRLRKEEGLIDWTQSARRIHDRVRGLHPWPHAYSYLDGARVIVLKTTVGLKPDTIGGSASVAPDSAEPAPQPGSVAGITRDAIEVATGDGRIAITELQSEGKRPMTAREFLAGRPVRPGMTFESGR
jgi:methionyl-tRNA formyltransferase